jgi:hypothetical protein
MGLAAWPKTFFSEGIQKFVHCWTKCVEKLYLRIVYCYIINFNSYSIKVKVKLSLYF